MTTARRGRGEGNIREREPGKWEARYVDSHGRRQSVYAASKTGVLKKLRDARTADDAGLPVPDRRTTVASYLASWLMMVEPTVRPATYASYKSYVNNHLADAFPRVTLAELSPAHIERLMSEKSKAGLSPRTISHLRAVLRAALAHAERQNTLGRNVARLVKMPHVPRAEIKTLSPSDGRQLIGAATSVRNGAAYVIALTCGLRLGECLGLRWADLNEDARTLTVAQAYQRVGGVGAFVEPKSARSRRSLPIPDGIIPILRAHKAQQNAERLRAGDRWRDHDLMFSGVSGEPLNPSSTSRHLHKVLADAGLPQVRFHDLRHSFASALIASGDQANVVSEMLGHSSVALTLGTYAHVNAEQKRRSADTIGALFYRQVATP